MTRFLRWLAHGNNSAPIIFFVIHLVSGPTVALILFPQELFSPPWWLVFCLGLFTGSGTHSWILYPLVKSLQANPKYKHRTPEEAVRDLADHHPIDL